MNHYSNQMNHYEPPTLSDHERMRRQLWIAIAEATAAHDETRFPQAPAQWANEALKAFDETFK